MSTAVADAKELLFDQVPDCATENILRFFSTKPRTGNWISHIPAEADFACLKCAGSLRRVAQNASRAVQFAVPYGAGIEKQGLQVSGKYKEVKELMHVLPVAIGDRLHTVRICAPLSRTFTRAIARNCSGLRPLLFQPVSDLKFCCNSFLFSRRVARIFSGSALCVLFYCARAYGGCRRGALPRPSSTGTALLQGSFFSGAFVDFYWDKSSAPWAHLLLERQR